MIESYKPVTTFGTHSLAGLFAYLLFFLTFRTYQKTGRRLFLGLAVLHVAMCLAMRSTTSLALSVVALAELAYTFRWKSLIFAPALYFVPFKEELSDALQFLPGEGNGFGARYGPGADIGTAIAYIRLHPLLPIGVTYPQNVSFIDSGPVEYMLRGSVPLVILLYGGLFLYLHRNTLDKRDFYRLFAVLVAAEFGFSVLIYMRSFVLIPAFLMYLNSLSPEQEQSKSPCNRHSFQSCTAVHSIVENCAAAAVRDKVRTVTDPAIFPTMP